MKTTINKQLIEVSVDSIEAIFNKIKEFSKEQGYTVEGELKQPTNLFGVNKKPEFKSKKQMKVIRRYINRLDNYISMSQANRFLHQLFKHVYGLDKTPRVEYSDKELKIKELKKVWKKIQLDADNAQMQYKLEKGDFYKK